MRRLVTLSVCLLFIVGLASCDFFKTDLDQVNPQEPTQGTYYKNMKQLRTGINGIYDPLQGLWSRSYYFAHDLLANDAFGTGSLISDLIPLNARVHGSGNGILSDHWTAFYESIKNANIVIASIQEGVEGVSESDLTRLEAEARFLRAFSYYELVTKYGEVPLILDVKQEPGGVAVSSQQEVYDQILSDLQFAENNLPLKSQVPQPGRAPRGAAYALEGETHLFLGSLDDVGSQNDWENARQAFQAVIDLGEYRLMDDYFANYMTETENNAESIFEIQFKRSPNENTNGRRRMEYGMLGWRNTLPHPQVVQEFEDGDPRKKMTMYEMCDEYNNGQDMKITSDDFCGLSESEAANTPKTQDPRPDWKKYENYYRTNSNPGVNDGINLRVIRYAEVLIGLAEAQIELGNIMSSANGSPSAVDLLNQVRNRPSVNMPDYPTAEYPFNSYEEAIEGLYHEYAVEFGGEQVFYPAQLRSAELERRPNYLERRAESVATPQGYGSPMTQDKSDLVRRWWPIPQTEIASNPEITEQDQNPGY